MVNEQPPPTVHPSTTRLYTTKPLVRQYDELLTLPNTPPDLEDLCFLHSQLIFAAKVCRIRGITDTSVSRVLREAEAFRLRCRSGSPSERLTSREDRRLQTAIENVIAAPTTTPRSQHPRQGGRSCPLHWHSSVITGNSPISNRTQLYVDDAAFLSSNQHDEPFGTRAGPTPSKPTGSGDGPT